MSNAEEPVVAAEAWARFQQVGRQVMAVSAEELWQREAEYRAQGPHRPRPGKGT